LRATHPTFIFRFLFFLAKIFPLAYLSTVSVSVAITGTTATSPDGYTLAMSTLTFASAAPSQLLRVNGGDLLPEHNETVVLRLGTPSNANVVVAVPGLYSGRITVDNSS
jgi:hypothetical protein